MPPANLAAIAVEANNSYDQNVWYVDNGANALITSNAANLTNQASYEGDYTIQVGNSSGLVIKNTGNTTLKFDHSSFKLNNILHCRNALANILSINQSCLDNDYYFLQIGTDFCVNDNKTDCILLQRLVENRLYPFVGHKSFSNKMRYFTAKIGIKASLEHWHNWLGHPAKSILDCLCNYFSFFESLHKLDFCNSCQLGKTAKLSFVGSTRVSTKSLQLVHTHV